jgi:cytochrome c peroxidase
VRSTTPEPFAEKHVAAFSPLPTVYAGRFSTPTPAEMDLGRQFFYDKRFSKNHDVSCNSCHPLLDYGMDNRGVSLGHVGQTGTRNAPSVYNAAGHGFQFWDGRAEDVEAQAPMPVMDPFEMAMSEERLLATLRSIPEYAAALKRLYPEDRDPVSIKNFGKVIGAFERGLVTPSRWDDFLAGAPGALTPKEKAGFMMFRHLDCVSCHEGRLIGGGHFEALGQVLPWPNQTDKGRNPPGSQTPMFKVASLRNVAKTAPYFHDASAEDLPQAVRLMAAHQLGLQVTDEQVDLVVTWLGTLTGDLPLHHIYQPDLPESTAATPKPTRDGH